MRFVLWRLVPGSLGLALLSFLTCAALASPASAGQYYCDNLMIPPNTECGVILNTSGTVSNFNQSYVPGDGVNNSIYTCEGVKVGSNSGFTSFRCGGTPTNSTCDVSEYTSALHMYAGAGNNTPFSVDIQGEGYASTPCVNA